MIRYDRDIYFDAVRADLFSGALTQEQVDGQNVILSVWELQTLLPDGMADPRFLAYMLATTYHETAYRMWPIEEYGKGSGHEYGETDPETGQAYYGRGLVQLTWRDNYAKATDKLNLEGERDIEWHAAMALDSVIATKVLFAGMREGWFTSKKLSDYFTDTKDDPVNARQIINGNDKDTLIAGYHDAFLNVLDESAQDTSKPLPSPDAEPAISLTIGSDQPVTVMITTGKGVRLAGVTPGV